MKRIFTLMNLTMLMTASLMMTSCMDDDTAESITLSGQWTGNFGMFYDYEYRGQIYTFNSYDTDIVFYPDYNYATHGYGYEVDFYNDVHCPGIHLIGAHNFVRPKVDSSGR